MEELWDKDELIIGVNTNYEKDCTHYTYRAIFTHIIHIGPYLHILYT